MKELQIQRNHVYGADCKIILGFSAAARVSTPKPHVVQGSTVVLATTKIVSFPWASHIISLSFGVLIRTMRQIMLISKCFLGK